MTIYANIISDISADFKNLDSSLEAILDEKSNFLIPEIRKYIFSSSKRIRSTLIFLLAKAFNEEITSKILNLAAATELIHNATLIHDDIIDDSDLRRDNTTLNYKFDSKLAVIAGDFLFSIAMKELVNINNMNVVDIYSKSLTKICDGEINQYFAKDKSCSIQEYIEKSKYKTAKLFEASLNSVVEILEKPEYMEQISNFAINFGIAFQIRDDLLNITKTAGSKPVLNDIDNGVCTAPLIFLFEKEEDLNFNDKEKIIKWVKNPDIILKTRNLINIYVNLAIDSLEFLGDNLYKDKIIELCKYLCEDDKN